MVVHKVQSLRLLDFLINMATARTNGAYRQLLSRYSKPTLFVLDELMLLKSTQSEQQDE